MVLEHKYPNNWVRLEKRAVEESIYLDTNKDVVDERVANFIAELQSRGYHVQVQEQIDDRIEMWQKMANKLNANDVEGQ